MTPAALRAVLAALPERAPVARVGRVTGVAALHLRAALAGASQGGLVRVERRGSEPLLARVAALAGAEATLLPLGTTHGLEVGAAVIPEEGGRSLLAGPGLVGRVLDGLGRPIDGRALPPGLEPWPLDRPAPAALARRRVSRPLALGVRSIDAALTAGEGQRLGLFAGAGAGKSSLLARIARGAAADVVVVGLVGERGREVRDFVEEALGTEGLARSVVVAATGDAPPLVRMEAAHVATAIAEWFAERGRRRVLLLLDSVTRYARAAREVGLAAGEPPARQGYPPSVFAALPRLVERAGNRERGGITAVYTVLVAGGDLEEPIADELRGLLDGHVVLDPALAARGFFPAVDVLRSASRTMAAVAGPRQLALARRLRELLAAWERQRDAVALGAYAAGSDPATDEALRRMPAIEDFLRQDGAEASTLEGAIEALAEALG